MASPSYACGPLLRLKEEPTTRKSDVTEVDSALPADPAAPSSATLTIAPPSQLSLRRALLQPTVHGASERDIVAAVRVS
jgi:hypothetical protein